MKTKIIGWTFEAAHHCPECTEAAVVAGSLTNLAHEDQGEGLVDREGNEASPIYSHTPGVFHCDDCFVDLE